MRQPCMVAQEKTHQVDIFLYLNNNSLPLCGSTVLVCINWYLSILATIKKIGKKVAKLKPQHIRQLSSKIHKTEYFSL